MNLLCLQLDRKMSLQKASSKKQGKEYDAER